MIHDLCRMLLASALCVQFWGLPRQHAIAQLQNLAFVHGYCLSEHCHYSTILQVLLGHTTHEGSRQAEQDTKGLLESHSCWINTEPVWLQQV